MIRFKNTSVGLPNTCSVSGEPIKEDFWFAANDDQAYAGAGISLKVAQEKVNAGEIEADGLKKKSASRASSKKSSTKSEEPEKQPEEAETE